MSRRLELASFALAVASLVAATLIGEIRPFGSTILGIGATRVAVRGLLAATVLLAVFGMYRLVTYRFVRQAESKRRLHTFRSVLRLAFTVIGIVGVLAVVTEQWLGFLFSLGVLGFAVTFALQQPILSVLGWMYIMVKQPYSVGDRVQIEGAKGDVIDVDFLVTTLWEINGELVTTNQPSGRVVTLPNSVVLSTQVYNYSWTEFPFVWNELHVQVAFETDLAFAREAMRSVADDFLGDEMEAAVDQYYEVLGKTPVELTVGERPSVNIRQDDSWVNLRLRYLVHPKEATRVRNELYEAILTRFNEHPDRVQFPLGRNR